jgi:hypothetical protein
MKQPTETDPSAEWQERLDTHLRMAMEALVACAAEGEGFQPVAAFVKPNGEEELALLVFAPEAKERSIAGVTGQARESGCRGLILVMDAWAAPPVPGREARAGDAANHPQREECLVLMLFTPNGAWGRQVRYRREGKQIGFQPADPWFPPTSPWNPWAHVQ